MKAQNKVTLYTALGLMLFGICLFKIFEFIIKYTFHPFYPGVIGLILFIYGYLLQVEIKK